MYSYFFLISLLKSDENHECMGEIISEKYQKIKDFPKFGQEYKSNTLGFGVGEQANLIQSLKYFSSLFPDCVLAYYHFYWNCQFLTVYTIDKGEIYIDKHNLENFKVGPYFLSSSYNIENTKIPNNITCYLNSEYKIKYEKNFFI